MKKKIQKIQKKKKIYIYIYGPKYKSIISPLWTYILVRSKSLKLKCLNHWFVSYKKITTAIHYIRRWLMDWNCLNYCDVFYQLFGLSFWRFILTHSLQTINWWTWCDATFLKICSHEEIEIYILDGLLVQ